MRETGGGSAALERVLCPDEARVLQKANQIVMYVEMCGGGVGGGGGGWGVEGSENIGDKNLGKKNEEERCDFCKSCIHT